MDGELPHSLDSGELPEAVDSANRCRLFANAAKSMNNHKDLLEWVTHSINDQDKEAWNVSIQLITLGCSKSTSMRDLWLVSHGGRYPNVPPVNFEKVAETIRNRYWNWSGYMNSNKQSTCTFLTPIKSNGTWYIAPILLDVPPANDTDVASLHLIELEAFRQQLDERVGIKCPVMAMDRGNRCMCKPLFPDRPSPVNLDKWAQEGRFGDGEWTELTCRCHY